MKEEYEKCGYKAERELSEEGGAELGEPSPGIASPGAFLTDRTNLQFPQNSHSLHIQPGSSADSLGWRKSYSAAATQLLPLTLRNM